jgi:hypothetical protein
MGGRGAYSLRHKHLRRLKYRRSNNMPIFKEIEKGAIPGIKIVQAESGASKSKMPDYSITSEFYATKDKQGKIAHLRVFDPKTGAPIAELDFDANERGYVNKKIHIHDFTKVTRIKHASRKVGREINAAELDKYAEQIRNIREYNRKVSS